MGEDTKKKGTLKWMIYILVRKFWKQALFTWVQRTFIQGHFQGSTPFSDLISNLTYIP